MVFDSIQCNALQCSDPFRLGLNCGTADTDMKWHAIRQCLACVCVCET